MSASASEPDLLEDLLVPSDDRQWSQGVRIARGILGRRSRLHHLPHQLREFRLRVGVDELMNMMVGSPEGSAVGERLVPSCSTLARKCGRSFGSRRLTTWCEPLPTSSISGAVQRWWTLSW